MADIRVNKTFPVKHVIVSLSILAIHSLRAACYICGLMCYHQVMPVCALQSCCKCCEPDAQLDVLIPGGCPEETVGGEQEAMWHEVLNLAAVPVNERPCPRLPPFM